MKKYMIVPYQEPKISLHEKKINSILKNNNINKDNKIKLINHILINNKRKNENKTKLPDDSREQNERFEVDDQVFYEPFQINESYNREPFEEEEELEETEDESFSNALLPPLTRSQGDIDTPWRKTPRANRKVSQKRKLLTSDEEPIKKQSKLDKDKPIKIIDTINIDKKIKKAKKNVNKENNKTQSTNTQKEINTNKPKKTTSSKQDISMRDVTQEGNGWKKY